jgi:putative restriction endonuclease
VKIKEVAQIIGRTPAALAYKLMNFTSLDPERQNIGNKGKSGSGKMDALIWNEYTNKWDKLAYDSFQLLAKYANNNVEFFINEDEIFKLGIEKNRNVKVRINQADFRQRVLASYNEKCCITGLDIPELLVASHIIPWAKNAEERLNPKNGLCLNSIHDKAFDRGLITITKEYKVKIADSILKKKNNLIYRNFLTKFNGQSIIMPDRYIPSLDFLEWHNKNVFKNESN